MYNFWRKSSVTLSAFQCHKQFYKFLLDKVAALPAILVHLGLLLLLLELFPTRLLTSEDEYKWFWHQMLYFPGTINIVSTQLYCYDYVHQQRSHSSSSSCAHQLTLCMLAFWSCEGVVFPVLSPSSHFTTYHVFPLPLSGANWRSPSWLWGSGPPFSKMAPLFTGSAHTPFPGSNTGIMTQSIGE